MEYYKTYSRYLQEKYGEKVYKLPLNIPVTCPNKVDGPGCSFCADVGTGFEAMAATFSVKDQLEGTVTIIQKKYKANKYIAYFQNYTNTYLPLSQFAKYIEEAAAFPNIVEISVSTRPDAIAAAYLDILKEQAALHHLEVTIELGLQTVNYHSLDQIKRGHSLAEYLEAAQLIKSYGFTLCTHVILNLPGDTDRDALETAKVLSAMKNDIVKIHSLYIAKNTPLAQLYEKGELSLCSKEEYLERLVLFIRHLKKEMVVERLFSRIPEQDCLFSNWQTSWWKLKDEFNDKMAAYQAKQGDLCNYLGGRAVREFINDRNS
ncbi:TIGR01212 family radical SAM protein [Ohessyouella blattaphilus]|uniref:TIGR01212 family radical SAM protein n=1 Tax=Ohessyouella blattaphilus TaxID=2949333 RepID=A0ABT1EHP5_9FIRM|nr:TIGR01212 family radical SAM protein [Ohessyouella blattaphilus]MCP1109216.1 TIGR01212 family radical SAM protein [Ohessyouella blattaphilus]MCR8562610.1 TIGR01212 family radical SAM protein [Ohessyouella blattaphilus]